MKKVLSIILVAVMLQTFVPFAYAQEEPEKECEHDNGTYVSKEEKGISTTEEYWTEEISCSTCGKVLVPSIVFPPAPMCYAEHENSDIKICDYCEKKCLNENYEITSIMSPDNKVYSLIDGNAVIVSPCRPNSFGLGPYTDSLLDYYLTSDPQVIRYKGMINEKNHCLFFTVEEDHCEIYTFIDMENGFYIHDMYIMNVPEESSESLIGKVDLEYVINLISQFEYSSNIQIDEDNNHVTYISKEAASPTATEPGRTEERTCAICEQVIKASEEIPAIVNEGQCGDNAYWEYDETTKTLYITGEGPMWDGPRLAPEHYTGHNGDYYRYYFEHLVIGDGITKIGAGSFYDNASTLKDIHFGSGVEEIGRMAFMRTNFLENLVIPGNVKKIGTSAFAFASGLRSVILEEGVETIGAGAFGGDIQTGSISVLEELIIPSTVTEPEPNAIMLSTEDVYVVNNSPSAIVGFLSMNGVSLFYSREFAEAYKEYQQMGAYCMANGIELTNEKYGVLFSSAEEFYEWINAEFENYDEDDMYRYYFDNTFPENIQIDCLPGSAQHEVCKTYSINHYFTDFTCDLECGIHASVSEYHHFAPTCTENGYEGGKVCSVCLANATTPEEEEAAILEAPTVIPATGHSLEKIEGIAPTCTSTGLTDGVYCKTCGEIMSAQEEIPALNHADANNDGVCDNCGRDMSNTDVDHPEPLSFGERIMNYFRGIVNAILALFKRIFG